MIIRHNKTFNGISLLIFAFIHITYNFTLFSVWLDDVNGPEYARSSETYFKDIRKSIVKINQLKAGVFLWRWKKKCVLWSWYITCIGGEKHVKIFFPKISGARKGAWTTTTATATAMATRTAKNNRFKLAKQQLGTCITLLCTFPCRYSTSTTRKVLISRFMEDVNTTSQRYFVSLFVNFDTVPA